ncbi:MAG TPA: hypothetical protein VNA25_19500 [Phycisphaerae bacterium]|nr:hypothetical protein [Phycisphaerae bacterium]
MLVAQWAGQPATKTDFAYHRFLATERVDTTAILTAADATIASAVTYTSPDAPRTLTVDITGSVEVGTVVVVGTTGDGGPLTTTVAVTGDAGPVAIEVAFWTVATVTPVGFTGGVMDVGIQDMFGLPFPCVDTKCVMVKLADKVSEIGTVVPGSAAVDADSNGTWEPATWVGEAMFEIVYLVTEL